MTVSATGSDLNEDCGRRDGHRLIGLEETGAVWGTSALIQMRAKRLMSDLDSGEDQ